MKTNPGSITLHLEKLVKEPVSWPERDDGKPLVLKVDNFETHCRRSRMRQQRTGAGRFSFVVVRIVVSRAQWATLPIEVQCPSCRRTGGLAARCATQEDITAIECFVFGLARAFTSSALPSSPP